MTKTVNHQTQLIGMYSKRGQPHLETFTFNLAAIVRILASSPVRVKSHSTLQVPAAPEPTVKF
jgi:hypothetical protein